MTSTYQTAPTPGPYFTVKSDGVSPLGKLWIVQGLKGELRSMQNNQKLARLRAAELNHAYKLGSNNTNAQLLAALRKMIDFDTLPSPEAKRRAIRDALQVLEQLEIGKE